MTCHGFLGNFNIDDMPYPTSDQLGELGQGTDWYGYPTENTNEWNIE